MIYLHIIFSTKNRRPFLRDKDFRLRLHAYLARVCNNMGCNALKIGGVEDHTHLLTQLARTVAIAKLVQELKRSSSKWIKSENSKLYEFSWQSGYGAFSISPSHVTPTDGYIERQEEHHRTESYKEEFRRLCKKYNIEIDERYCWD
jgi:putative transposase